MDYEIIVAMSKNRVIGHNHKMPWNIPEDLQFFKHITMNSIIVMGRKTFDSLPNGPLLNRFHIVITRTPYLYTNQDNVKYCTYDDIIGQIEQYRTLHQKVFIIGGAEIYKLFLNSCAAIHITLVDGTFIGDTYFPYTVDELLDVGFLITNASNVITSKLHNVNFQHYNFIRGGQS
jgi:dihydrofolate reductase